MLTCQRHRFSLLSDVHYLNNAYMSPLSRRVVEVGIRGVRRKARPWEIEPRDFFDDLERARGAFATLAGVPDPVRVAVVPSASYGLAQAARNTRIDAGQAIVLAAEQFPSNVYVWRRRALETGARVVTVPPPADASRRAEAWNEALLAAVDGSTAAVAVGHVHWTDGTLFDLAALRARSREVGAALVVDGTQSVGAMACDVASLEPDALVCAAYKWLMGPYAIGLAYYGPRYDEGTPLEETWLAREGSDEFARLVDYADPYRSGARRYDVGEASNFILLPMLVAALEEVGEWGPDRIAAYARALTADLVRELRAAGFWVTEDAWRGGHLFGVRPPPGYDLDILGKRLRERRVIVSRRGSALRVSVHAYNDPDDIEALRDALLD